MRPESTPDLIILKNTTLFAYVGGGFGEASRSTHVTIRSPRSRGGKARRSLRQRVGKSAQNLSFFAPSRSGTFALSLTVITMKAFPKLRSTLIHLFVNLMTKLVMYLRSYYGALVVVLNDLTCAHPVKGAWSLWQLGGPQARPYAAKRLVLEHRRRALPWSLKPRPPPA